ncbi:FlxA-like family protein [Pectobacteriaceae bacterium CE90]|nr:FlxA-like family protein [Prodigiosinella sp. LS101]WJV53115.1 FlxA-like family protein [Prodigiosinella sp. LS101]WJV57471.1 FlxA-like family protein [Pectobacteriaceae bacterium C111]WJY15857.1 FlxA-like family protein [Pectobacteriaceae bacterium CE90]
MISSLAPSAFAVMPITASSNVKTNTDQKVAERNLQNQKVAESSVDTTNKQQTTSPNAQQQVMQAQIVMLQAQIAQLQNQPVQPTQESKPLVKPVEGVNRPSAEHAIDVYI